MPMDVRRPCGREIRPSRVMEVPMVTTRRLLRSAERRGGILARVCVVVAMATALVPAVLLARPTAAGASSMGANDDNSVGPISVGFNINWFGTTYNQLWINNNGGVNLAQAWSAYSGLALGSIAQPVIAPIFTDIDTRGAGTTPVTYGTTTYEGHSAFCVDWVNVGHYSMSAPYYSAQLLLVDRSDTGAGNVDAVFNFDWIGTSTYPLTVGYAAANGTYFQMAGSQQTPSPFVDGNGASSLTGGTSNSGGQLGRYTFAVRGGIPPASQTITFPNPGSQSLSNSPVTLQATASSGLPVTYTATSGPCTVSGNQAILTGTGTCTITATGAAALYAGVVV